MSKRKAKVVATDAQIDAALARAESYDEGRPKAVAVTYLVKKNVISIEFSSGVQMIIPRRLMQGLESAAPADVAKVEVDAFGSALHWPTLDVNQHVPGLCEGILGTQKWMAAIAGAKGGSARTSAQTEASRRNGRKGGGRK